ncbi:hypothetical protein EX30DRAFT_350237 [Ascodesmis nigricans]|uniref:non-specific serine/threonine protein kinase n=1 Tax=Ascodesmis nigricans TaxID=341454 RepID=A0A4V3SIB9_9PEZI|nr:hypothetical protein EX30DRAFT_350237 [Ascodesmis nigricans]
MAATYHHQPSPIPEFPSTPPPPPPPPTEPRELYRPGGYHPIPALPHALNDEYRLIHKLAFDAASTTWLAVRTRKSASAVKSESGSTSNTSIGSASSSSSSSSAELVEIKLLTADSSKTSREVDVLKKLCPRRSGAKKKKSFKERLLCGLRKSGPQILVQEFIDQFYIDGPNGRHLCIAMEPLGPSVADVQRLVGGPLPPRVVRATVVSVVKTVEAIHAKGAVHCGLSSTSPRFHIPHFSTWTPHDILARIGQPEPHPFTTIFNPSTKPTAHTPPSLFPPASLSLLWPHCIDEHDYTSIRLTTCTHSFLLPSPPTATLPTLLRTAYESSVTAALTHHPTLGLALDSDLSTIPIPAPEVLLAAQNQRPGRITQDADVFSLGCALYAILGGVALFVPASVSPSVSPPSSSPSSGSSSSVSSPSSNNGGLTPTDLLLAALTRALGRPPQELYKSWRHRTRFFTDYGEDGLLEADGIPRCTGLEGRWEELIVTDGQNREVGLGPGEVAEVERMVGVMVAWEGRCKGREVGRMLPRSWVLEQER